jgi:hypothetical protein
VHVFFIWGLYTPETAPPLLYMAGYKPLQRPHPSALRGPYAHPPHPKILADAPGYDCTVSDSDLDPLEGLLDTFVVLYQIMMFPAGEI